MKISGYIVALFVAVAMAACGDSERFTVQGTVDGGRSMNLRYSFYTGDAFMRGITAVRDGRFNFEGTAPQPVLIELYDNDYRLLGRLYAEKGDEIECRIDPTNPYKMQASGRKDLERWSEWMRENAESIVAGHSDSLVEAYVGGHPDDIVSTLLLTTLYDASTDDKLRRADSLLALIVPEARPMNLTQSLIAQIEGYIHGADARLHDFRARISGSGTDTVRISDSPLWLMAISTERSNRRDSVVPVVRGLHKQYGGKRLRVLDISLDQDTTAWRRIIRGDSAKWMQAWLPGGTAARGIDSLAIPSLPYFVAVDSTGHQLMRTTSAARVRRFIEDKLK